MATEESRPGGQSMGTSGQEPVWLVTPNGGRWRARPATLVFASGFLDGVAVEGLSLDCPRGARGASVTLHLAGNRKVDGLGSTADIWRMRWADGAVVENQKVLSGVPVDD